MLNCIRELTVSDLISCLLVNSDDLLLLKGYRKPVRSISLMRGNGEIIHEIPFMRRLAQGLIRVQDSDLVGTVLCKTETEPFTLEFFNCEAEQKGVYVVPFRYIHTAIRTDDDRFLLSGLRYESESDILQPQWQGCILNTSNGEWRIIDAEMVFLLRRGLLIWTEKDSVFSGVIHPDGSTRIEEKWNCPNDRIQWLFDYRGEPWWANYLACGRLRKSGDPDHRWKNPNERLVVGPHFLAAGGIRGEIELYEPDSGASSFIDGGYNRHTASLDVFVDDTGTYLLTAGLVRPKYDGVIKIWKE